MNIARIYNKIFDNTKKNKRLFCVSSEIFAY